MSTVDTSAPGSEFRRHWRALSAATIGTATSIVVLPFYTNGLFIPELEAEFGWTRAELTSLPLIGSVILILTAPLVGVVVDRFGARVPASLSLVALAASFLLLSLNGGSFLGYAAVFASMYLLASASTAVSFSRVINERFDRRRGIALGITFAGGGVVAFLAPRLLGTTIAENWRAGYQILGIVTLVGALLVLLLMPGRGDRSGGPASTGAAGIPATVIRGSVWSVVRTSLFVRLSLVFLTLSLAVGGMTSHLVPLLRDSGVDAGSAAATASLIGIAIIVGRLGVGLLVDRFFAPYVGIGVLVLASLGYLVLLVGGPGFAAAAAVGIGLALAAEVDLLGYITARYYGITHYSRIFGMLYAAFTLGIGAGPLLLAELRAATGGYGLPLIVSLGFLVFAAVLLATLPRFPVAGTGASESPVPQPATR